MIIGFKDLLTFDEKSRNHDFIYDPQTLFHGLNAVKSPRLFRNLIRSVIFASYDEIAAQSCLVVTGIAIYALEVCS